MGPPPVRYLIDTNVWIDAIAGRLDADSFLRLTVQADWVGYSAITRLELFGFPGLMADEEQKISQLLNVADLYLKPKMYHKKPSIFPIELY